MDKTTTKPRYAIAGLAEDDDWQRVFDHLKQRDYWLSVDKWWIDLIIDVAKLLSQNLTDYIRGIIILLNKERYLWIDGG